MAKLVAAHLKQAMLAATTLASLLLAGARVDASVDPPASVIVWFRPGGVALQAASRSAPFPAGTVRSERVERAMLAGRAERIERAFPDTELADTLGVSRTGEVVRLTDWSRVYVVHFPSQEDAKSFADSVNGDSTVSYVELSRATGEDGPQYPNDPRFQNGEQWNHWNVGQSGGTPDADVDTPEAWGVTTGTPGMVIGIVDTGVSRTPEDLAGRVIGHEEVGNHGTQVAGVAGAISNNAKGIAGVHWSALIYNAYKGAGQVQTVEAIEDAIANGAVAINNSWPIEPPGTWSDTIRAAFADAYKNNRVSVASSGNTSSYLVQYPAGFPGVIAVANTDRNDERFPTSTMGPAVDLAAPGTDIITTNPGTSSYLLVTGTSFSAPHVTGAAALLLSRMPSLYNDDVEQILKLSADDLGPAEWDSAFGWGRINIRRALDLISAPNVIQHSTFSSTGPYSIASTTGWFSLTFYGVAGLEDGHTYKVRRYEVRKSVIFSPPYASPPIMWGRGVGSVGFNAEEPNFGIGFSVPINYSAGGATFATYVYEVHDFILGFEVPLGWFPCEPAQIQPAYTALKIPRPNVAQSFYVPERGPTATPAIGNAAVSFFRTCPNNDGGTSLPDHARIKIVLRDAAGESIVGVPADSIFIRFNGGTAAQGFSGDGADSIIANNQYNPAQSCPDVRLVYADAPTNASGTTYITFAGASPDSPGVAVRNPNRKWGHYDTELPVYVYGLQLQGRLTSPDTNGSYILRIKNCDLSLGLGTALNLGEMVTSSDFSSIANNIGNTGPLSYWRDLDSSGAVTSADLSIITQHQTHDCNTPMNP